MPNVAVKTIPAKKNLYTDSPLQGLQKRKVAGYARVSTDLAEQLTSYEAQVSYYRNYIQSKPEWEFVEVYTDEGISGTGTKKRDGFNRMIKDALAGKIDLIVTKSVSRFARNTVDSLQTIRELKEHGVEVMFEKENIRTFDSKGELLITIMSSLAQEESRSISENVKWGLRKQYADGNHHQSTKMFLGFDYKDSKLVVNEKEAVVVRRIYEMFLRGYTNGQIARALEADGIPSPAGKQKWSYTTINSILTNEKYKGDALLQKTYIESFLTKKMKRNKGELPQYYIEGDHEAIIESEKFDLVQRLFKERQAAKKKGYYAALHTFSGRIRCGDCGCWYTYKLWHSNDKYRKSVWQCGHKYLDGDVCQTPNLDDDYVKEKSVEAINKLLQQKGAKIPILKRIISDVLHVEELEEQRKLMEVELEKAVDAVNDHVANNANVIQDQEAYNSKYDELMRSYEDTSTILEETLEEIADRKARKTQINMFLKYLEKQEPLKEFSDEIFFCFVKEIIVYDKDKLLFQFIDGTKIDV